MGKRTKRILLTAAAVGSTLIATAIAVDYTGDLRRDKTIQDLVLELETAREASPVHREALYGETTDGSAWEHYALAIECAVAIDDCRDRCMALADADPSEQVSGGKALVEEAGLLFEHLQRGAHARDATRPLDWKAHLDARIVTINQVRAVSQLVTARAYQLIAEGDSAAAAQAMLDMQQFAADLMMSPVLAEEMIGCVYLAPGEFRCVPVEGGPGLSDAGKQIWRDGMVQLREQLPPFGRSYEGELELMARFLEDSDTEADWGDESPGWRYRFSWQTAAAEFAITVAEGAPDYRAAMVRPDGLDLLGELEDDFARKQNPAAKRMSKPLRRAALNRREAMMRLEFVSHALSIPLGIESETPEHPLGYPVAVEESGAALRLRSKGSPLHEHIFVLHR